MVEPKQAFGKVTSCPKIFGRDLVLTLDNYSARRGRIQVFLGEDWTFQFVVSLSVSPASYKVYARWVLGLQTLIYMEDRGQDFQEVLIGISERLEESVVDAIWDYAYGKPPKPKVETITYGGREYTRNPDDFLLTRRWSIQRPNEHLVNLCLDNFVVKQVSIGCGKLQGAVSELETKADQMFESWYRVV